MQDGEYFQEDIGSLHRDVNRLRMELSEWAEMREIGLAVDLPQRFAEDLQECRERVFKLLDRIAGLLAHIGQKKIESTNQAAAFHLVTLSNELKAQLDWLIEALEYIEGWTTNGPVWLIEKLGRPVQAALHQLKSYLMPLLKRFLSKLWQIISHMLMPKEWKLTGKVGTGVLGLADVGIEITFGP